MRVNMVVHIYNDKELLLMKYILSVFYSDYYRIF